MTPRLAVFKFASCDGCQLQFINAEAELLTLARQVDIAYFPEVRSRELRGPYDIAFVEGSIPGRGNLGLPSPLVRRGRGQSIR